MYIVRRYYTNLIQELEKDLNDLRIRGYENNSQMTFPTIKNDEGGCLFIVIYRYKLRRNKNDRRSYT